MNNGLRPGESIHLGTCCGGGPTIKRSTDDEDVFTVAEHGGELSRDEIKRLAELAGFEVRGR